MEIKTPISQFNLSEKQKLYGLLIGIALILLITISVIIPFLFGKIKSTSSLLTETEQDLANLQNKQRNLENFDKEYQDFRADLKTIDNTLLHKENFLDLILVLEEIAKRSNNQYDIKLLAEYAKENENTLPSASFQISLWGNLNNLIDFLFYLENSPYLNKIKTIQIQRIANANPAQNIQSGDIKTRLLLKVYLAEN